MKQLHLIGLSFFLIFSSACVSKTQREWDMRKSSPQFSSEKATFKQKMGGKAPCWKTGIIEFTYADNQPFNECLYPTSRAYWHKNGPAQSGKQIKVVQTTAKGFLVEFIYQECTYGYCREKSAPLTLFIHRTDEKAIADDSYFDEAPDGALYEYTGPYTYATVLGGSKTVRSFKKVPTSSIADACKGMSFYNPDDELFAETGSWDKLEESFRSPDRVQLYSK